MSRGVREEDLERDRGDGEVGSGESDRAPDADRGEMKVALAALGDAIFVRISRLELEDVRRTFSLLRRMSMVKSDGMINGGWLLRLCCVSISIDRS